MKEEREGWERCKDVHLGREKKNRRVNLSGTKKNTLEERGNTAVAHPSPRR